MRTTLDLDEDLIRPQDSSSSPFARTGSAGADFASLIDPQAKRLACGSVVSLEGNYPKHLDDRYANDHRYRRRHSAGCRGARTLLWPYDKRGDCRSVAAGIWHGNDRAAP